MVELNDELYDDLFKSKGNDQTLAKFKEKYNIDIDIIKELQPFITNKKFESLEDFKSKFNKVFKNFDFYFKIGIIKIFSDKKDKINKKENDILIRQNELIQLNNLPGEIKDQLKVKIEQEKSTTEKTVVEEFDDSQYWVLHIQKISSDIKSATENAHKELAKSLGILNLLSARQIFSFFKEFHPCYIVMCDSKLESIYSFIELEEIFPLTDTMIKRLDKIENIFKKNKKNDIDKRIIKALDIYSQIQKSTEPIAKVVIYMTMLENLLLVESDRDYLNWKLADRVAFLIGNKDHIVNEVIYPDFSTRFKNMEANNKFVIYTFVKDLYDIRSSLVHSNKSETEIEMFDKFLLIGHNIILNVIMEFLDLENKKITKLGDLIDRLECIKYNNTVAFEDEVLIK